MRPASTLRVVTSGVPSARLARALGEVRCRFGQNLPFYEHAIGLRHSGKGAEIREIGKRLWLGP